MKEEASMDQAFLDKVHEAIEKNLVNEKFGVEELALEIGISRIHLHRKLKFLTGQSASHLIKEFRLKKAMEMLQNNVATSSEISYQVGFGSPSYFNTCFREYYGYPPGKVKRKRSFKTTRKHAISRRYIFASIAIFVLVALIVLNIIPRSKRAIETEIPDKFIAVLPFESLSDDPEQQYLADGVMYAILLHLSKIEDLRVLSRISVEQYRTTDKTATEICQELDVGYLLVGRFRKHVDQARLFVYLIQSGKEDYVWTGEYDREWKDIFTVESEVAQIIAGELNAAISPEEKELIEKIPTTNLTAYDFYQRGREEFVKYWIDHENGEALKKAVHIGQKSFWIPLSNWQTRPCFLTINFQTLMLSGEIITV
jgi:TolB-like protein